jgi:LPS export ABC transporter protein LptC
MINAFFHKRKYLQDFILLSVLILGAASCENDLGFIQNLKKPYAGVDEVKQVESFFSQNGKLQAKLYSPLMLRYHDTLPRVEFPNKLHVDFYGDTLKIESYLDAQKGSYFENVAKVVLEDSVVVIRNGGDTLKTNKLIWEQSRHSFYTNEDVEIRQKTKTIFGKGFESDEQLRNFSIDTVTGVMLVESNNFPAP